MTRPTDMEADVLVVGAGLAGLCTGIRAAELGMRVRVLERGTGTHYLCNSRYTGGLFHIGMDDLGSEPDEIVSRLTRITGGEGRPELARTLARNARRMRTWLNAQGVRMIKVGHDGLRLNSLAPPGVRNTGLNWRWRAGDVMLRTLVDRLRKLDGTLDLGVAATELLFEDGRVNGVIALSGGDRRTIKAPVVVICDGGFQADRELVGKYISKSPDRLLMRNAETGRGDGVKMAGAAGAKLVGMDSFYGHIQYRDATTDQRFWPYPVMDSLCVAGLLVDGTGRRFCDESLGGVHIANRMAKLDDPLGCQVIFDEATWEGPGRSWLLPANPFLLKAGGALISAPTLRELAVKIGLDPDHLESEASQWNDAVAGKTAFAPARANASARPEAVKVGPFHAVPLCAGVTYTMGGLLTDSNARVLDETETPIPGLLAAGACTGGLEGFSRSGYSGGLSKSAIFGMIAGETAATIARSRHDETMKRVG